MSFSAAQRERLLTLLDAVFDQRAQAADYAEIEEFVLADSEAKWLYLTYVELHGTLIWDAASGLGLPTPLDAVATAPVHATATPFSAVIRQQRRWLGPAALVVSVSLLFGMLLGRYALPPVGPEPMAAAPVVPETSAELVANTPRSRVHRPVELAATNSQVAAQSDPVPNVDTPIQENPVAKVISERGIGEMRVPDEALTADLDADGQLDEVTRISRRIDRELAQAWRDHAVSPAPLAEDSAWLRRVMLDLCGRIPTVKEIEEFHSAEVRGAPASARRNHRRELVEKLLSDGDYVRNFTTVWRNLLIGRSPGEQVNAEAFQKFLRLSFAANRPWNEVVAELLSAEGRTDENGATNYLVAHLNNQAVPATAITSRLFLGQQLHCAQCHNHPFNAVQQASFWELNSLFQQTAVVRASSAAGAGGKGEGARRGPAVAALVTQPEGGPIYYETTNGLMKVAFPRFNGQEIDSGEQINRRQELARLLTTSEQPQLAAAFVNRMWAHFFGAGFTTPVDDMGPHNPPSHPEVLNLLRDEFVRSGYDVKHLIRCITMTNAYQLSSEGGTGGPNDDPETATVPLFSRMYPKPMTAEQLYDSLVVATRAHQSGVTDWTQAEVQREAWLREFVVSLNNDENDEAETLSGTYSQALTLMNGELMDKALDPAPGTFLGELVRARLPEAEKIRQLCLAALSRPPTAKELPVMQRVVRDLPVGKKSNGSRPSAAGYQDLFWALLNSNEFAIVH